MQAIKKRGTASFGSGLGAPLDWSSPEGTKKKAKKRGVWGNMKAVN